MNHINEFGEYTHWKDRKTFSEERKMVEQALKRGGDKALTVYLLPLVKHWVKEFRADHPLLNMTEKELVESGFKHLELAIRKYSEKIGEGQTGYKFSTYFEWYIRQGLKEVST